MKRFIHYSLFCLVLMASLVVLPGTVSADENWILTDKGYKVWDNTASSDETVTWSGAADAENYVTGKGVLQWFYMKEPISKYEGEMLQGKRDGQGIMTFASIGESFEGTWHNDKMNGNGIWRCLTVTAMRVTGLMATETAGAL